MLVGSLGQCKVEPLFDEETQKKLKVLEIIKEKFSRFSYEIFIKHDLTKEEYDLLKKYLK